MARIYPRGIVLLVISSCVLTLNTATAQTLRNCPIRKLAYRIQDCYYRLGNPLVCAAIEASLRLCGVHVCGRDSSQPFPEVCFPRNRCPAGFVEHTNAVCGRQEDCCYSRASTCETLSLPVLLTYNETIPIPGSDSQNESLAFLGSDSLNGSVAFLGSQIDNGSLPEPGSEAFDEFLTESLSGVDADNEGFPVPESNVTREVERAFGGDRFYTIRHALGFTTLCDTQADGGGWTVVQRRTSGVVSFDRRWNDYVNGFGNTNNGYWLGLRYMRALIERGNHEVRFEFTTSSRQSKVVQYNRFSIGPDWDKYRLLINALDYNRAKSSESGFSIELHNLMRFTTVDRDNDVCLLCNCAFPGRGGWWHYSCATANLNGLWGIPLFNLGPSWIFNAGLNRPLRSTAMMIRLRV